MPSAEELAASLEAGETMDDQFLAGHGGKFSRISRVLGGIRMEHKLTKSSLDLILLGYDTFLSRKS